MSSNPRGGPAGRPARPRPDNGAADPVAEAATRKLVAEQAVSRAAQELAMAKAAVNNSAQQAERLAKQRTQVDALSESVHELQAEATKRAEALLAVHKFREADATITRLEHDLLVAERKAAAPEATRGDAEAFEAARTRLQMEKELRHYDEHKRDFAAARKFLDEMEAEQKRIARKRMLERTRADLQQQGKLREMERDRLKASAKAVNDAMDELGRKVKEVEQELAAI